MYDLICIGGGAAGFFTAICYAERNPGARVLILEKSAQVLGKVKVSGGGRCNVTHACFDPREMIAHYPRGSKELIGPFNRFLCGDMMGWLSDHGVETKIEEDGRTFPTSDSSQTIIDCFMQLCEKHRIKIETRQGMTGLIWQDEHWHVTTTSSSLMSKQVMLATGSSPAIWNQLADMGYAIEAPVPSLFTFNIKHRLLEELPGISMPSAYVKIVGTKHLASGPLLITHWGLSGPGVLKLSAWAARELHQQTYRFEIEVDWLGIGEENLRDEITRWRSAHGKRQVKKYPLFEIPRRLWERFCYLAKLYDVNYASLNLAQISDLVGYISCCKMDVNGKSTFKEEFVTCGGVDLKQIDFKRMESRLHPHLYMAGEVLNIDAITGGFNFQAAWTEGYIAAESMI